VLVVDDEEPVRRIAARILARHGFDVVTPESPQEALAIVAAPEGDEFDLLVTDIVMPQMSGTDLAARACESRPGLKVLFMSGYPDSAGEVPGAAAFLPKPFDEQALLRKVREALAGESVEAASPPS
jgi:DNA-binding NtrC family response regulator